MKLNNPMLVLAFHLLVVVLLVIVGWHVEIGDWGNYYYGSTALMDGCGSKIYDAVYFNNYVERKGAQHFFLSYTQVPPLSQLLYFPFIFLKVLIAKTVFIILSYCLCIFSIGRLFRKMQIDLRWSLLLPLLFLLPIKSNVELGQSYFLLVAFLAEGWMARENKKYLLAGIFFALAIHLKIFPAILLLWFLFEKDWRSLFSTSLFVLLFGVASLAVIHEETWRMYLNEVVPRLAKGEINNTYATSYQSLQVLLKQLFVPDKLHNPDTWVDAPYLYTIGNMFWRGVVLVLALLFTFDKKHTSLFRFSFWLFAGILVSGYGSSYGLLQLIFLVIAFISLKEVPGFKKAGVLFFIFLISNIPIHWFSNLGIPFNFPRLIVELSLFVFLIALLKPKWNSFSLFALLICAPLVFGLGTSDDYSEYVLNKEPSLLITALDVRNDSLVYQYRDKYGMHEAAIAYGEKINSATHLKGDAHNIQLERIWYFPGERISNPFLINENTLVYLSDKNRGIGFYTIRKRKAKRAGFY